MTYDKKIEEIKNNGFESIEEYLIYMDVMQRGEILSTLSNDRDEVFLESMCASKTKTQFLEIFKEMGLIGVLNSLLVMNPEQRQKERENFLLEALPCMVNKSVNINNVK